MTALTFAVDFKVFANRRSYEADAERGANAAYLYLKEAGLKTAEDARALAKRYVAHIDGETIDEEAAHLYEGAQAAGRKAALEGWHKTDDAICELHIV